MAALNQTVDFDTAALAADHFGFEAESEEAVAEQAKDTSTAAGRRKHPLIDLSNAAPGTLVARPPIVAVLGHVDHGKTSLLDAVRKTKVAAGEAGGITQVISAYQVERNGRLITFIDTPGHAAFTAMRARGADVTDVAILVVAADDGVMPQTEEAIQHIHAAGVPIVVAMNKIDKDGVNPDRALQQLAERGVVAEQPYGGDVPVVRTSARTGEGIDDLLESVLTVSDILVEPKADPSGRAVGHRHRFAPRTRSRRDRHAGGAERHPPRRRQPRRRLRIRQGARPHRRHRQAHQGSRAEHAGRGHRALRRPDGRRDLRGRRDRARRARQGRAAGLRREAAPRPAGAPDHARRPRAEHLRRRDEVAQPRPQGRGERLARGASQPGHQDRGPDGQDQGGRRGGRARSANPTSTSRPSPTRS